MRNVFVVWIFLSLWILAKPLAFADPLGTFIKDLPIDDLDRKIRQINGHADPCAEQKKISRGSDSSSVNKGTLRSPNGKSFDVSVVSKEEIQKLFTEMANQKHIPFKYPEDGCYARAHEMVRLLEQKNIIAAKAFIEGSLWVKTKNSPKGYVEWRYHVAPTILVQDGDKVRPYVIDPSIFDKAVPVEEWYEIQTKPPKGHRSITYETPRFQYGPGLFRGPSEKFDQSDVDASKKTLQDYMMIQRLRESQQKNKSGTQGASR